MAVDQNKLESHYKNVNLSSKKHVQHTKMRAPCTATDNTAREKRQGKVTRADALKRPLTAYDEKFVSLDNLQTILLDYFYLSTYL